MRVLIADDDRVSARLLEANLRRSGYEVTVVADGAEAWEVLNGEDRPQIAVLDWMMPVMDGPEVCRKVRAAGGPYVYILLLTGNTAPDAVVTGIDAGADDYLRKPCDDAELKARLRSGERIVELEEKLRHQATRDGLTGLLNRVALMERLDAEIGRANREGEQLSVAMVDIDYFKKINDTYGHSVGDLVLREAAKRMSSVLRPYDAMGRYGGEEFVAILPKCALTDAAAIAERIRQYIAVQPFETGPHKIALTVSIGVAGVRNAVDADAVIHEADNALFLAKQNGRNRIEVTLGEAEKT